MSQMFSLTFSLQYPLFYCCNHFISPYRCASWFPCLVLYPTANILFVQTQTQRSYLIFCSRVITGCYQNSPKARKTHEYQHHFRILGKHVLNWHEASSQMTLPGQLPQHVWTKARPLHPGQQARRPRSGQTALIRQLKLLQTILLQAPPLSAGYNTLLYQSIGVRILHTYSRTVWRQAKSTPCRLVPASAMDW